MSEDRWIAPVILQTLREMANRHGVSDIAKVVLDDSRFRIWAGSSVPGAHHHYDGGLAEHTLDVAMLCEQNARMLHCEKDLELDEMFLAALFHDTGKMWDYEKIDGKWVGTEHKRLIHHISRSGIVWVEACSLYRGVYGIMKDRVLHAILAHHGKREWGSPVAPKTKMAWLLHLCDQLSARMNDCDTNDLILRKDK